MHRRRQALPGRRCAPIAPRPQRNVPASSAVASRASGHASRAESWSGARSRHPARFEADMSSRRARGWPTTHLVDWRVRVTYRRQARRSSRRPVRRPTRDERALVDRCASGRSHDAADASAPIGRDVGPHPRRSAAWPGRETAHRPAGTAGGQGRLLRRIECSARSASVADRWPLRKIGPGACGYGAPLAPPPPAASRAQPQILVHSGGAGTRFAPRFRSGRPHSERMSQTPTPLPRAVDR